MSETKALPEAEELSLAPDDNEEEQQEVNVPALEEQEVPLPTNDILLQTSSELENELASFRNEWRRELNQHNKSPSKANNNVASTTSPTTSTGSGNPVSVDDIEFYENQPANNEQKAEYLFGKGVQLEQHGRYYEAIKFYRMSMQLDANIEFKMDSHRQQTSASNAENTSADAEVNHLELLCKNFHQVSLNEFGTLSFCQKNTPQKATHISDLPYEVIILVLRWVVGDHLDVRSLDKCAQVCKGFYLCSRDAELWRSICARTWGGHHVLQQHHQQPSGTYMSWREMYFKRPHVNFEGVYISKTSYARAGEQSLDNFYRPWHLVEYYRYLRFFSDGTVLFLTTPDEPKLTVSKFRQKPKRTAAGSSGEMTVLSIGAYSMLNSNENSILRGTWSMTSAQNRVSIVLLRRILKTTVNKYMKKQIVTNYLKEPIVEQEHTFRLDLDLNSFEHKLNAQLSWCNYEIQVVNKLDNTKSITKLDLNRADFPTFYFSRVKSYSATSEKPLK